MWGWGRAGMILATALLFRHAVTFDQAVILILLNVVLDRLVYGKPSSPWPQNRSSARSKADRLAPAGGSTTARPPEPHPRRKGSHQELGSRHN